jgi:exosortase
MWLWLCAVVLAAAGLYGPAASGLGREWLASGDTSYGLVMAAVAGLLAWRRRRPFIARSESEPSLWSLAVLGAGLILYMVGMLGADLYLTRTSFVVVAAGALLFVAGHRAARVMAAPLLFVLLSIPPPALVVNAVTFPLQLVASSIAEASLAGVGVPVFREGNVLFLPSAAIEVAEACSGLRSLVSLGALAVLLAWASEQRLAPRLAIVAAAIPLAVVMDGFRVALTGLASEAWGPAVATGSWHSFTGWLTFVASMGSLLLLRRAMHTAAGSMRTVRLATA